MATKKTLNNIIKYINIYNLTNMLIICLLILFVSCGKVSDKSGEAQENNETEENIEETEGNIENTSVPESLSLKLTNTSVKSDDSDNTTITATVLDKDKAVIEGLPVTFNATSGELSTASVNTNEGGEASVMFSSGTTNQSNQVVTITATVKGIEPKQIPVQVIGTNITLATDTTNLSIGGDDTSVLSITVQDAGQGGIYNIPVTLSLNQSSTGIVSFSSPEGVTDINGKLDVNVIGKVSGKVIVVVEAQGATATQTYFVDLMGSMFGITSPTPTENPYSLKTNTDLTIIVNAPSQSTVQFASTLGGWDSDPNKPMVIKSVSNSTVSAIFRSPNAGIATIQVMDPNNQNTIDLMKVAVSAPSDEAAQIALQANAVAVPISAYGISNTVLLTATVKNLSDEPVGNAPVIFTIQNPTGGGETISPVIAYTNDYGVTSSTFTSGSLSSGAEGVMVKATVIGSNPVIEDIISIVIGGTAGSVTIGRGTKISAVNADTTYQLPMSIIVADSNGNPMAGVQVTLSLWPSRYATGYWVESDDDECIIMNWAIYDNEDKNKNLILDALEDLNGDGELTAPNSAAGSIPGIVITDENGVANFNLFYLKASAAWIEDEIIASTLVLGTETRSTYKFWLPYLETEVCSLPDSPYN